MKSKTKIKVLAVSNLLTSASVKNTSHRHILTVIEVPEHNPYGRSYEANAVPFEIEVHNENIVNFGIGPGSVNGLAEVEIVHWPYKKDANTPLAWQLLVNNLQFIV